MDKFRVLLLDIAQGVRQEDLSQLKFLCKSFIPAGRAESITTAQELFLEMERMGKLSENNLEFLAKCLNSIGRIGLKNKLLQEAVNEDGAVTSPTQPEEITEADDKTAASNGATQPDKDKKSPKQDGKENGERIRRPLLQCTAL